MGIEESMSGFVTDKWGAGGIFGSYLSYMKKDGGPCSRDFFITR